MSRLDPLRKCQPTLSCREATRRVWDVLVIGAGPAGALAAREAAVRRASVLLVDRAVFPRRKVCGCCLNASALAILEAVGLGTLPARLGAQPIRRLRLSCGDRDVSIPLPDGAALSREALDSAMVAHAIGAGAEFLPGADAELDGVDAVARSVGLRFQGEQVSVKARVVLVADGLGGRVLRGEPGMRIEVARHARIGVGTLIEEAPRWCPPGTIVMACGRGGYAGLVRIDDGRLAVAAAFDPSFVQRCRGAGHAVAATLREAGVPPIEGLPVETWRGTPALTCAPSHVAAERLFVLGDAAGYVEPFTGEGMTWALASGQAVAPLAVRAAARWEGSLALRWERLNRALLGRRRWMCRVLTGCLRSPRITRAGVRVLSRAPRLIGPLVSAVNAAFLSHDSDGWRDRQRRSIHEGAGACR